MFELAATNSIARLTVLLLIFGLVMIAAFVAMTFFSRRAAIRMERMGRGSGDAAPPSHDWLDR